MAFDYLKMTVDTLATLPLEKQVEVYDFAKFLKTTAVRPVIKKKTKKGSLLKIVGLGKSGAKDIALNHDKYLYDE